MRSKKKKWKKSKLNLITKLKKKKLIPILKQSCVYRVNSKE